MSKRRLVVFDFETTSVDPDSEFCDVVEIGAVAVDSKTLNPIPNSEFYIDVRPNDIEREDFYENRKKTIDWHVGLKAGRTVEGMIEKWKEGTPEKDAFKLFIEYCNTHKYGRMWDTAPVGCGNNVINYDIPILKRKIAQYKLKYPFFKRDVYDIQQQMLYVFGYNLDPPSSYSMDNLRTYFGMSTEDGHNALFDAQQEAELICYLTKKMRSTFRTLQARGALENV